MRKYTLTNIIYHCDLEHDIRYSKYVVSLYVDYDYILPSVQLVELFTLCSGELLVIILLSFILNWYCKRIPSSSD